MQKTIWKIQTIHLSGLFKLHHYWSKLVCITEIAELSLEMAHTHLNVWSKKCLHSTKYHSRRSTYIYIPIRYAKNQLIDHCDTAHHMIFAVMRNYADWRLLRIRKIDLWSDSICFTRHFPDKKTDKLIDNMEVWPGCNSDWIWQPSADVLGIMMLMLYKSLLTYWLIEWVNDKWRVSIHSI